MEILARWELFPVCLQTNYISNSERLRATTGTNRKNIQANT